MSTNVVLPALPTTGPLRLTPTDVSQFVRLEQCERFLRFRLAERAGQKFMEEYDVNPQRCKGNLTDEKVLELFQKNFPEYQGKPPLLRGGFGQYGEPDDAQIMDEPLFQQLKEGFCESLIYTDDIKEPNVIFYDELEEAEWPKTSEEAAQYWVVVIDYHY